MLLVNSVSKKQGAGKKLGFQERFLIKLENIYHHTLNASQNLNISSLVSQLPNLGCFCWLKFQEFMRQLRKSEIYVTKCKETSKLRTEGLFLLKKNVTLVQNLSSS